MSRFGLGPTLAACAMVLATAAPEEVIASRIERYCTVSWQNAGIARQDWGDCTQEAFVELLQRISRDRWPDAVNDPTSDERRELNRSIWCIVKRWQRAPRPERLDADAARTRPPQPRLLPEEWAALVRIAGLTSEQKQVLELWSGGIPVAEIASRLKVTPSRVSDQKFKAIQRLRDATA